MESDNKRLIGLFSRYIAVFLLGLGNLYLFYKIFTPLTIKTLALFLSIFEEIVVNGSFIHLKYFTISIVPACVAGSAFYLLFILVFSTPDIKPSKRALVLFVALFSFFFLNLLRIFFLVLLIGQPFFETIHWVLWNLVSTIFVVLIWVTLVKLYKIEKIPIYSDFMYVLGLVKDSRKKH